MKMGMTSLFTGIAGLVLTVALVAGCGKRERETATGRIEAMGKNTETATVATPAPATVPPVAPAPIVDTATVETVFYRYAGLDGKTARLFSALCALDNPATVYASMMAFIDDIRKMARMGASKAFTFPDGHPLGGKTGRDALNAIVDDRESNGAIRKTVKANYK